MANIIINWEEAMQQVGEDEEFLRELLTDLRGEVESQLSNIAAIIQVSHRQLHLDCTTQKQKQSLSTSLEIRIQLKSRMSRFGGQPIVLKELRGT